MSQGDARDSPPGVCGKRGCHRHGGRPLRRVHLPGRPLLDQADGRRTGALLDVTHCTCSWQSQHLQDWVSRSHVAAFHMPCDTANDMTTCQYMPRSAGSPLQDLMVGERGVVMQLQCDALERLEAPLRGVIQREVRPAALGGQRAGPQLPHVPSDDGTAARRHLLWHGAAATSTGNPRTAAQ